MKELIQIQSDLKAPKSLFNKFGKYNYRSAEDILEAVKPLLATNKCVLIISEEVKEVGPFTFIESTAKIDNGKESVSASGVAGIEKAGGMALPQAFGSASSYAKKYAMGNLFLLDDTKDADATNDHSDKSKAPSKPKVISDTNACKQINACKTMVELQKVWMGLTPSERLLPKVIEAKDNMKAKIGQA